MTALLSCWMAATLAIPQPGLRPQVVTVRTPIGLVVAPGATAKARIAVKVVEGFHVQANPASQKFLIPTRIEVRAAEGIEPGEAVYPRGKPYRIESSPDPLSTYDGTFEIALPLRAAAGAAAGERVLRGTLRYQACDSQSCLAPVRIPVEIKVTVKSAR